MIVWPELKIPPINLWNIWNMEPKSKVDTENFKGFTNYNCEFYPCHKITRNDFNCLYCYCPLAWLECPGVYTTFRGSDGVIRKDCSECILPHNGVKQSWNFIQKWLKDPKPWKSTEINEDYYNK